MQVGDVVTCTGVFAFNQSTFEAGRLSLQATGNAAELSNGTTAQRVNVDPVHMPRLEVTVLDGEVGVKPTRARESG